MINAAVMLALAVQAAAAPLSPQFDLVCVDSKSGERYRFRLDLDQNRWCEGECVEARPISAVTADRYTLFDYESRSPRLRTSGLSYIDRQTGEHWEQRTAIGSLTQITRREGRCERAAFSGMPEPRL